MIQHEPLGFHDYNCLQMNAYAVVSDSGTLPEESSFFTSVGHPFPAICIRTSTERPEALDKACFSQGLTGVTDAGLSVNDILLLDSMQQSGELLMKINAMLNPDEESLNYFLPKGPLHKERLAVCSIKLYADGALGSRGAHLIEPYSDDPGNYGIKMFPDEYYDSICRMAYAAGFQVCTHAIGDAGVRNMLNASG